MMWVFLIEVCGDISHTIQASEITIIVSLSMNSFISQLMEKALKWTKEYKTSMANCAVY